MRAVQHRYRDPLDHIWIATAQRIGLRVERGGDVYAATDGAGALTIGEPRTLDPDDCLAQMIFHELCHSLIEGPDAFSRPDWGLDNTDPGNTDHDRREHACLRLQAVLAAEHGLRRFLAPTTDFRDFYDALPDDPLQPRHLASVTLAMLGLRRAAAPPWAPHLHAALQATAAIAGQAARFTAPRSDLLHATVEPALERHPLGAPLSSDPGHTCATCAWRYLGGRGVAVDRCRQTLGARVSPDWRACWRWEPVLDCHGCGACCREGYDSVTISRREPVLASHPALIVDRGEYIELARVPSRGPVPGTRCAALQGGAAEGEAQQQPYTCAIYDDRPRPCRELERGGAHCLTARRRVGLSH